MTDQKPPFELFNLAPLRDRVLVRPLANPSLSRGGLVIAENSHQREKPQQGLVISVGPGRIDINGRTVPMQVQVGDCVFFGKFSGQEFDVEGRRVLNMAESEIYSRLGKGFYALVEHDNEKDAHLQGQPCELCLRPGEDAARQRLETARLEVLGKIGPNDVAAALEQERARVNSAMLPQP